MHNVFVTLPKAEHTKIQSVKKMSLLRYFPRKRKAEHTGQENDVHGQLTQDGLLTNRPIIIVAFLKT